MSEGQPLKAHVIDQSLNEPIVMSYYIIASFQSSSTDRPNFFHNHNDRLNLANQKPNTTVSLSPRMLEMEK